MLSRDGGQGAAGRTEAGQPRSGGSAPVSPSGKVSVLVVDDHRSFSDLLVAALSTVDGIECVGSASSAVEGLARVAQLSPSVVVMDISMPGLDGLAATRQLRRTSPGTAVAVVTAHCEGEWIARAARAGASAYIPKGGSLAELIAMLKAARPGPMVVAASLRPTPPAGLGPRTAVLPQLTPRELEVLGYLVQGLAAKNIATVMGISVHTCRSYIRTVYAALDVKSRIQAVNQARQLRLFDV
jgi:DNA-binding NarL/FixJ family response regulator